MAEVEMEVDVAPPFGFNGHVDEDLIDYDIETTEEHMPTSGPPGENLDTTSSMDAQTDVPLGDDSKISEAATEAELHEPQAAVGDLMQDESAVHDAVALDGNMSHGQSPSPSGDQYQDDIDIFETEQAEEHDEIDAGDIISALEAHDVENEIDYEDDGDGDITAAPESHDEQEIVGEQGPGGEVPRYDQDDALLNVSNTTPTKPRSVTPQSPGNAQASEPSVQDQDEITWEQDEDDDSGVTAHDDGTNHVEVVDEFTSVLEHDGSDGANLDAEAAETAQTPNHSHPDHIDNVDFDQDDTAVELEEDDSTTGQQEVLASQPEHSHSEEEESFPAITVQYKGDEFPFFSHARSEGFFVDLSVLDNTMESVLAGFRAELANEIAGEDELVFQVDELGLEFAEDASSSITLRQILEIFDLLVKNQDPDNSRTLYTYLFTKPSTGKRFEFLMESATTGKGLDEVIHLFESPMPHAPGALRLAHATNNVDENFDSYESAVDENGEADDTVTQQSEHQETEDDDDNDDDEDEDDGTNDHPADDVEYHDDGQVSSEDIQEHVEENEDEEEYQHIDVDEIQQDEEEDEQIGGSDMYPDDVESDHQATAQETDQPPSPLHTNEHVDSDSNPFIHLELDEPEEADVDEFQHEEAQAVLDDLDDDDEDTSLVNTSSTHTLTDNGELASTVVDTNTDHELGHEHEHEHESTEGALVDQDELAEIDWRDEADLTGDAGNDAPDTLSGVLKRPRTDDEQSMEQEYQDVKRRRS